MSKVSIVSPADNVGPKVLDLTFTEAAIARAKSQLQQRGQGKGIRIAVKVAGCSGLKFIVDFVDEPAPDDTEQVIDEALSVYVDAKSLPFVQGTTVDYLRDKLNSQFRFSNPKHTGTCGCGESFTVDDFDK